MITWTQFYVKLRYKLQHTRSQTITGAVKVTVSILQRLRMNSKRDRFGHCHIGLRADLCLSKQKDLH